MRNELKGVIFDMDGVIVNSEPLHEKAFREVFAQIGLADRHGIDFSNYFGRSDKVLWVDFIAKHNPPHSFEELAGWKQSRFIELLRREQPIYPLLPELVQELAGRFPLAVASGSLHATINEVLAIKDLRRFFSAVASSEDVSRSKPAPDVFLHAASLLGLPPESCCVIEDSEAGVEAGRAAGMTVIAITNSLGRDRLQRAHHIVTSYTEIPSLLPPSTQKGVKP
jgi:HAD superfamily hydrolase (TIGR01509 family)